MAPLLNGFPVGTVATSNSLVDLATLTTTAEQQEDTMSLRVDHRFNDKHSAYVRYLYSNGEVDTPDRTVTPRRVLAKQQPQNFVGNFQSIFGASMVNEFKVGLNLPETSATAFGPAGLRPDRRLAVRFVHLLVDRRARHDRHRPQRPAHPRHQRIVHHRFELRPAVAVVLQCHDDDAWRAHLQGRRSSTGRISSKFQFLGSNELSYNGINEFIDNRLNQYARDGRLAVLRAAAVLLHRLPAGLVARRATA